MRSGGSALPCRDEGKRLASCVQLLVLAVDPVAIGLSPVTHEIRLDPLPFADFLPKRLDIGRPFELFRHSFRKCKRDAIDYVPQREVGVSEGGEQIRAVRLLDNTGEVSVSATEVSTGC